MALVIKMDTGQTKSHERSIKIQSVYGPIFFQNGGRMTNVFGEGGKDIIKALIVISYMSYTFISVYLI